MRLVQSGADEAFDALKGRHEGTLRLHLLRYVGPSDVDDLVQEALLRLWDKAAQWDGSGSPLAWLLRIATNLALNHIRDSGLRAHSPIPADGDEDYEATAWEAASGGLAVSDEADLRDQAARLLELMLEMPEDKRSVLQMARLQQMKLQEIADEIGVPLGTIKSRLHSATQWLAARWEDEE